jgi:uncharacterized protein YqeY
MVALTNRVCKKQMRLEDIAKALKGFGGRNTIDLDGMLVEYLQERREEASAYRIDKRIDLVAKWLDEALECVNEHMSAHVKERVIERVCEGLLDDEEELKEVGAVITATSAREMSHVCHNQGRLREFGLSRAKLGVMQDIHRARADGRFAIHFKTDYYDYDDAMSLGPWLQKLGFDVESGHWEYNIRWHDDDMV